MNPCPLVEVSASSVPWPREALAFVKACAQPTWIVQRGADRSRLRVVSTLLHGNEPSGTVAVARWLASGRVPAVDTVFYIASIAAALASPVFTHRHLPDHPDANRTFRPPYDGPAGQLALEVLDRIQKLRPEALIDLHNNTGHNPAYGVATSTGAPVLALTSLFASRLVHSDLNLGAMVEATAAWCPSVVIECGRAGDPLADETAWAGLERFVTRSELELNALPKQPVEILRHPVRVSVKPGVTLALARERDASAELTVDLALEGYNFMPMPAGVLVGWAADELGLPMTAVGAAGTDVADQLFRRVGPRIETAIPLVPVMMTVNPEIALSDCLFYATRSESLPNGAE